MKNLKKYSFWGTLSVVVILIIGMFLRLWNLNDVPVSIFGDELDAANQANSILQLGKDYMGNNLPVYFQSFAEYRLPMQLYAMVPSIAIFGLNEWGVRIPAVIFGMLSLVGFYFLTKEVFEKKTAIITLLFLSVSPWHMMYSRQANDAGMLPPFVIFGTLFFFKGRKNYKYLLLSTVIFSLALYSYAISSVFLPLYIVSLLIIFRRDILSYSIGKIIFLALIGLLIASPFIRETFKGSTTSRFSYIGVVQDEKLEEIITSNRKWSDSELTKVFYNRYTVSVNEILRNYVNSFSATYLFVDGDPNLRQSIGSHGEFYLIDMAFIIIGFVFLVKSCPSFSQVKKKYIKVLIIWLLLAPIPSSLTGGGGNHASRLILMLYPLIVIAAYGTMNTYEALYKSRKYILIVGLTTLIILSVSYQLHRYFVVWPGNSWRFWHHGYKQAITYAKENDDQYRQIFFNNTYEPVLPRFLFWYDYDMDSFHEQFTDDKHIEEIVDGYDGFALGNKYYFGQLNGIAEEFANTDRLVIAAAEREITNPNIFNDPRLKLLRTIKSPTNLPIFYIFTGTQNTSAE